MQRALWAALEDFCGGQPHLRVDYHRLKRGPAAVVGEIIAHARLAPTPAQINAAVAFIDRGVRG